MNNTLKKSAQLLTLLLSVGLIAGCGAERDEPFNPDTDGETGEPVLDNPLEAKDQKLTSKLIDYKTKRLQVFNNQTEFNTGIAPYTDTIFNGSDFDYNLDEGQIVLIDMGEIDNCEDRLAFSNLEAYEHGDNGVKVIIDYTELSASTGTCTTTITRPYHVYFIDSTGPLVFEENIN